jgi:AraC-like DNA-binding protein
VTIALSLNINRRQGQIIAEADYTRNEKDFSENDNMKYPHYHDHYEIYYFLGERMTYFLDDRSLHLGRYDTILVDRNIYHRTFYYREYGLERINVSFNEPFLQMMGDENLAKSIIDLFKKPRLKLQDTRQILKLNGIFLRMCEAFEKKEPISVLKGRFILYELLLTFLEQSEFFYKEDVSHDLSPGEKRISDIVAYINLNYMQPLTLESISQKFYISKYHLCHTFKNVTGLSLTEFINRKRMWEAVMLLKYTDHKILDICEMTGVACQGHFIELFKRHYDCTPSEYRRAQRTASGTECVYDPDGFTNPLT